VPFDIGGTKTTSLNIHAYDHLKTCLGMTSPTEFGHYRSQRTHMGEEMFRFFDSDVRRVHVPYLSPLPEAVTRPVQLDEWGNEWTQSPTGLYFAAARRWQTPRTSRSRAISWPGSAGLVNVESPSGARRLKADRGRLDLPDGVVHQTQFLCGFDRWLMDCADNLLFSSHCSIVSRCLCGDGGAP
jgi:hypothetical protein